MYNFLDSIYWFMYFGEGKKKRNKFENMAEFQNTFTDFILSYLNSYKIEGLPDTCDERTIKLSFLTRGKVCIFEENGKLFSLPFSSDGSINLYGYPSGGYVFSRNGINKAVKLVIPGTETEGVKELEKTIGTNIKKAPEGVLVLDNYLTYPLICYIQRMSERIADCQRSIDILVRAAKSPLIITTEDSKVESLKRTLKAIDDNSFYILGEGNLPISSLKTLDSGVKAEMIKCLYEYKKSLTSEVLEMLSINSNPDYKKERLIVDEINVNNENCYQNLEKRIETQNKFFEIVNKKYNVNIKSVINNKEDYMEEAEDEEKPGGSENDLQQINEQNN